MHLQVLWKRVALFAASIFILGGLSVWRTPPVLSAAPEEAIERHRNLGKAFFENPTTHEESIAEFKQALVLAPFSVREQLNYALALLHGNHADEGVALLEKVQRLEPSLPHTWFNLGIFYKKSGQLEKATAQFERMIQLVPEEPIGHYQLGTLYRSAGRLPDAIVQCERASALNPDLAGAHFQLYNLYRQSSRAEDAAKQLAIFQAIKKKTEGAAIPEDVDWCNYGEIYDPPKPPAPLPADDAPNFDERNLGQASGMISISEGLLAWSPTAVNLYRNGTELVKDSGLEQIPGAISIAAGDFDNDGFIDLCVLTAAGPKLYRNTKGHFAPFEAALPEGPFAAAIWVDYDHDYDLDLLLLGEHSMLLRNEGKAGFEDRTKDFPFIDARATGGFKLRAVPDTKSFDVAVFYANREPVLYADQLGGRYVASALKSPAPNTQLLEADWNNDGRLDQAKILPDGTLHVLLNRSAAPQHWLRVQLTGIKNLKLAQDALVEVKAGEKVWKQTYAGAPLFFPVDGYDKVDVVRITWPNGLIQNETNQATNKAYNYEEAQRLSGSCPMIWTLDGKGFEFITDVLGVAPLGASDGEGSYFPVDHDEYVTIPGGSLKPVDSRYEVRITEELSEVSYLDQVQLLTLDHPSGKEIFTNEKFKGPPYPEFRLYEASKRIYPVVARDGEGRDVLARLLTRDRQYPDQFTRTELGVAKPHSLELDFARSAPNGDAVLLANGWVDWPDGSTFRAISQEQKGGLVMPYLQMQDAAGKWVTVNEDMGMPAGKPKTIAVPLHFISKSRKLRIVTDLCVYWDEIFLSETAAAAEARVNEVPLQTADLHFRGFSESVIDPLRKQPDTFLYNRVEPISFWNPTPGLYTRYGDVREIIRTVDDRLVIMGSGDELRLRFDASKLAPLPVGWTRDYLLKVDGWAKDRDPNTAFSQSVEPLPFHDMTRYPYPANERFPDDAEHNRYRHDYNTRPALRLLRPLGTTP